MTFYTELRKTAEKLLIDKGQRVTLRKASSGGYNPATGTNTVTYTSYSNIPAAVLNFKNFEIDGTLILRSDKKILLGADSLTVVPAKEDQISIAGVYHAVLEVEQVSPAGTDVIYKLQCRRI